jgi:hypothetical protein
LPPLIDGSDLDEQDLGDRQLGLDAAGLIHYPEDTVVYRGIPFGSVLSPLELSRQREEYETHLNREAVGLCQVIHPRVASVIYKGLFGHSWLVPHCLALSILEDLACPSCGWCWWGPEGVTVYSLTGVSVVLTNRDSAGLTDRRLRTRSQSYGWRSIGFFAANRLQHLFGKTSRYVPDFGPERIDLLCRKLSLFRYLLAGLSTRRRDRDCRGGVPEGNSQPN